MALLDGQVRTFCFWRKEHPSVLPLIVTVAYIPPEDSEKKNTEMRLQGLAAVPAMVNHVKRVWHGSQHVVVSHVNAPNACQVLRTQLGGGGTYRPSSGPTLPVGIACV